MRKNVKEPSIDELPIEEPQPYEPILPPPPILPPEPPPPPPPPPPPQALDISISTMGQDLSKPQQQTLIQTLDDTGQSRVKLTLYH